MLKLIWVATLAHASFASLVTHHERGYVNGWTKSALPVPESSAVRFTIAIREQNIDEVKKIALEVNTPSSPKYGNFLTQVELNNLTAPKASDIGAVVEWLTSENVDFVFRTASNVEVSTSAAKASHMLNTRFHKISNHEHGQSVIRATDYSLPSPVHEAIAAIFGLHGLPLPPTEPLIISSTQSTQPAKVTPDVLASTYKISGVKATGNLKNRQAVAEFQGQLMDSEDLATLFQNYVTDYKVGTDDTVFKYGGAPKKDGYGVEAELDIQYIMGPAVGVKTEFWEFPAEDFCNDLNQWSSNLTANDDIPIVHSVSYGWQGDLRHLNCQDKDLTVVDDNFAKLAAKGISIMISSGDSGSGYDPFGAHCISPTGGGSEGVGLVGVEERTIKCRDSSDCCFEAEKAAGGWTFVRHSSVSAKKTSAADAFKFSFENDQFNTWVEGVPQPGIPFQTHDIVHLNGDVDATGSTITAKSNGTWPDTKITFSGLKKVGTAEILFNVSATFQGKSYSGMGFFLSQASAPPICINIEWFVGVNQTDSKVVWDPAPLGACTIYSTVTGTTKANSSAISSQGYGPVLWPSWPASSPWVTAVGATRFVGQQAGNEEMATDQFGSGGGFSKHFDQEPNAKWQESAVASYLSTVDTSTLPPEGSFPPKGRATPDVAALGEGYQVIVNGETMSVGGTSASSPAFAAMVSLLNEARLNSGKKQMGFLNPFLYANVDAFTDVVKGSNKIGRDGVDLAYGFNCSKGWDPVTGLGTPKFDKLLKAAMSV